VSELVVPQRKFTVGWATFGEIVLAEKVLEQLSFDAILDWGMFPW